MTMQSSGFFLLSTVLVLLLFPLHLVHSQHVETTLPFSGRVEVTSREPKYYKLDVSKLPANVDVSISTISNQILSPKVYVSKKETMQFPNGPEADYYSTDYNGNVIFIPNAHLAGIPTLYVGLICWTSRCDADVTFEYTKEFIIEADGSKNIETAKTLNGASSAVVRLYVPEVEKADRIVIHVDAIPSKTGEIPELTVFIKNGNDIPYSNHAESIPRTSWFEGKTIVISQDTPIFCTDCNYTLSLKFNQFSSINVEAHVFTEITELGGNILLDGVKKEKYNTYKFKVQADKLEEDIIIDVKPQEGNPIVYINCDVMGATLKDYYWRYNINKPEEIVLTKREHKKCKTDTYYFAVYGTEPAVYSMRAMARKGNQLFVGADSPVVGDIFPNETITYEIFIPLFAAEKVMIDLTCNIQIKMDVINCRFPTDCPGLLPAGMDYHYQDKNPQFASLEPPEFNYTKTELPRGQRVIIDPHAEGCYPILIEDKLLMQDPIPVCAYKITLFSKQVYPEEYTLKANSQGHQWLFVGIPKFTSVANDETLFFFVYAPHKNISSVQIQLTKYSGDVDIYVSKNEKYPDATTDDTKFSHEGLVIFKDQPELNGTYYIGVKGLETSSFSISATVHTLNNTNEDYALVLSPGVPQRGVLLPKHEHPARFYKFTLDLGDQWEGTLKIAVNTIKGSVLMAVNNDGEVPLPNVHMWEAEDKEIEISSSDPKFIRKGTYYVGVFVNWRIFSIGDIIFNIVYYLKEKSDPAIPGDQSVVNLQHFFLSPLTPFHRTIKKDEIDFYEAFILPKDTSITIYKHADVGDVDLYVSLDSKNEYPNDDSFTYSTKNTHKDWIELNKDDLASACHKEAKTILCTFYVSVIPKGNQNEVSYSLTMKREHGETHKPAITALEDGRQLQFPVPADGAPAIFYFYEIPLQPSVVTVACPEKHIAIYANKNVGSIGASIRPDFQPPTSESYHYSSTDKEGSNVGLAYLNVPPEQGMNYTVVTLAVYFSDIAQGKSNDPNSNDNTTKSSPNYYILLSSQITHIYTGKPYFGAVEEDKYMYFFLNVYKPSCTLLIFLTTLDDGDPDLVVSASDKERPTVANHQFASISKQRSEMLEINDLDVYPRPSMEGTWVIGVYGRTASTFTLTVLFEEDKMVQLKPNVPFEAYLREESVMYFKYYHGAPNDVEIKIEKLSGDVNAYITTILKDMDLESFLPNKTNHIWSLEPNYNSILNVAADDARACKECLYLVALEAGFASKLIITISEGNRFVQVQKGLRYEYPLKPGPSKTYIYSSPNVEEIALTATLKGHSMFVYASHNPTLNKTNYLWFAELTATHATKVISMLKSDFEFKPEQRSVWDGSKQVPSEKNAFYFFFHNPTISEIQYTFTVSSKDSSTILKPGMKHTASIDPGASSSFLFYSSQENDVIKINIAFTVERDSAEGYDSEFERNLRKGLPVTASFWGDKVTTGSGREAALIKDIVVKDNVDQKGSLQQYFMREAFSTDSFKGKYSFEVKNPFMKAVDVSVVAYHTEFGVLNLEQNSQYSSTLSADMSETFEVYLGGTGEWYFWVYACQGDLELDIGGNPNDLGSESSSMKKIKQGDSLMYRGAREKENTEYIRLARGDGTAQGPAQFMLSSSFFNDRKHYTYEAIATPKIVTDFTFQSNNHQLNVKVSPISIDDFEVTDEVIYHIKVCPYKKREPYGPGNMCIVHEDCKFSQQKYMINNQKAFEVNFDRLNPGKNYVHVTADIQHYGKFIKFIPFPVEMVEIEKPLSDKVADIIGTIIIAVVVLAVLGFVCYKCYGRFKKFGEERGFELQIFGKRRGYGFLGDDA